MSGHLNQVFRQAPVNLASIFEKGKGEFIGKAIRTLSLSPARPCESGCRDERGDIGFGPKAGISLRTHHVRFAPKKRTFSAVLPDCPLVRRTDPKAKMIMAQVRAPRSILKRFSHKMPFTYS
jgi:hypothetical protein